MTFDCSGDEFIAMTVWDKDLSNDDFIGEATISVAPLKKAKVFKDWVTVHYKGKEAGKIYIEASFIGGEKAPKTEPAAMPMGYPAGVPGAYPAAPGGYPPAPVPGYAPAPVPE